MGIANAYAALESGVRRFDASIAGLGGCPFAPGASGNIATEDLVLMLNQQGYDTGISLADLATAARLTRQWLPGVGVAKSTQWIERQIEKGAL
jgi:hydroxymethylglutaryl-CoA lyase